MTAPQITLGAINVEAHDPTALADFWASVTGATPSPGGDSVYLPPAGANGFGMFFRPCDSPHPNRRGAHLDLTVPWGSRRAEVERLLGLGAVYQWDVLDEFPHVQWTTLADPEGNLFCLAEHPPAEGSTQDQ
ncbi:MULTISPECIES: VOC family protein [unclassified Cryobacterium]|uniref:VOC family protein n=1 Tax=unclassified Cryobacterium TaxID=2649013 RepID=UPI002AB414D0|nr:MULTISPECIES: VOC family protein [unclassified Cryobacterium]MDY7528939.1 VOC family protein [Cryobacterium sp. 10C2]MEB0200747.1 VOC family protein [Cryobacterium sp. 5I3]MEB0285584.1 VOC family protein [Cryobacterium sp. 10S3]MEB0290833.1 VOC family protein [Cryobacterium sp. 10C2]MEB0304285.1 VOC family protein [Cryobacterium sp. 10I1]